MRKKPFSISFKGYNRIFFYENILNNYPKRTRDDFYNRIFDFARDNKINLLEYYDNVASKMELNNLPDEYPTAVQFVLTKENFRYVTYEHKGTSFRKQTEAALCYYYENVGIPLVEKLEKNNNVNYFEVLSKLCSLFADPSKKDISNEICDIILNKLK